MILFLMLAAIAQTTTPPAPPPVGPRSQAGVQHADTDGDGIVTRAEAIARTDAMFARMDTNDDGKITADERRAVMDAMRAERRGQDGGVSGRGRRPGRGGDRDQTLDEAHARAAQRFDRLDTNKDGRLDAAERAAARTGATRSRGDRMPPASGQ